MNLRRNAVTQLRRQRLGVRPRDELAVDDGHRTPPVARLLDKQIQHLVLVQGGRVDARLLERLRPGIEQRARRLAVQKLDNFIFGESILEEITLGKLVPRLRKRRLRCLARVSSCPVIEADVWHGVGLLILARRPCRRGCRHAQAVDNQPECSQLIRPGSAG